MVLVGHHSLAHKLVIGIVQPWDAHSFTKQSIELVLPSVIALAHNECLV